MMYDFIFFIYYKLFSRTKDNDPKDSAINLITVVIFFHLFLCHNAVLFLADTNLLANIFGKDHGKYYYLPFVIVFMVLVYRFFKNRSSVIISRYDDRKNILSWFNLLFVLVLTIGPLLLGIYFLNYH